MNQLTLRQIPGSVEKRVRLMARETRQSINKTIIQLLEKALGMVKEQQHRRKRDLSRFSGIWTKEEGEEFERGIRIFEQIDPEVWQ